MNDTEDLEKSLDFITEQESEYAQNAAIEFNKKNYGLCLQNIGKLDNRTHEFKVLHNKYVADYFKSDLKRTDLFQKNLTSLFHQFHLQIDKLDDVDHSVAHFNQAIILYHQKQYTAALRIMDRVYKFIEPMDEHLCRQVGLLLVELHLCVGQIHKALSLITYLHNHALNQSTPTTINTTKVPIKHKPVEKEKKNLPITKAVEQYLKQLDKYKIKCTLMTHNIKRKEIQLLFEESKSNIEVLFLMANQEYLEGNYHEAIKLLTSIPDDALVYSDTGESSTVMFYNNMGVVHHAMGKHNMASFYYQKAIEKDTELVSKATGELTLFCSGGSRYHELMYNLGISLLHSGKAAQAFDCLIIAVRRYHKNSRLWLRLAECCIQIHKNTNESDFDLQQKHKNLIVQVIGNKETQKVILTTNLSTDKKYSCESQSYAIPVATLEFASICLRNAQLLLPSDTALSPVPLLLIPGVTPPAPPPSPGPSPSTPLNTDGIAILRNSILAASAYVSLCLGDYILALEWAEQLLGETKLSGVHKMLAHLYAAECYVLLDKLGDALDHLNPENIKDISFEIPMNHVKDEIMVNVQNNPPTKWFPDNFESAIAVVQYNVAVVKTLRGQLDQAATLLQKIWQKRNSECRVPVHIIMLVLYIELKLGHADVARSLIKQYSLQHRFNG